jgi:hypothetical protein
MSYLCYLCFVLDIVVSKTYCVVCLHCLSSYCVFVPYVASFSNPVLFLLANVLSVLLRFTDSDYPFGIFNLI